MILFFSDLDNTLIYSNKHRKSDDICIELNKGKEQGFMTPNTYNLFQECIKKVMFIPVTTRSIEQYNRIEWPEGFKPEYEITTNGAIIFNKGEIEPDWIDKSKASFGKYKAELLSSQEKLIKEDKYIRCRIVDDMYLFAYCKDDVKASDCAKENENQHLSVVASGKKLYFFPPSINKGAAVCEVIHRLNPTLTIAAGDSIIDVPMLNSVDIAIVPNEYLANKIITPTKYVSSGNEPFSEYVLKTITKELFIDDSI